MTYKRLKTAGSLLLLMLLAAGLLYGLVSKRGNRTADKTERLPPAESVKIPVKTGLRDSVVDFGMTLLGKPYTDGACSLDGFDCSGFVYYVFQHFNIKVPRSSSGFAAFGQAVATENIQKGDVLVFLSPTKQVIGHVGIVSKAMGAESLFIHASSGREMKVIISSLASAGYSRRFVKAVNVL